MSQVVVTDDKWKARRERSRKEEARIEKESFPASRLSDISGKDPVAAAVGVAVVPILAAWTLLTALMLLPITIFRYLMAGLGKLFGRF